MLLLCCLNFFIDYFSILCYNTKVIYIFTRFDFQKELFQLMDRKTSPFWATITVLFLIISCALCYFGAAKGILFARPAGNPQDAVTGFFNALKEGDYAGACTFVSNYASLGLENTPDSEEGQVLLTALKRSYDYTLSGSCSLSGAKASQKTLVRYLSLEEADAEARALPDMEYITALRQVLASGEGCCTSDFFDVTVIYSGGKWLIELDNALLSALNGGRS